MIKWILALFGYLYFRIGGAVLGYFIGVGIEGYFNGSSNFNLGTKNQAREKLQLNLLSLAAMVIKADGKVDERELRFVRNYFIASYGEANATLVFSKFNQEVKKEKQDLSAIARFFMNGNYELRLQIVHFLFGIAEADGHIAAVEVQKINEISKALGVRQASFDSIKAMFIKATDNAYKILNVSPQATDSEIKKAYRNMAKKYHPDKITSDDVALKKGAQEKFQQVQAAYEAIQKERKN